MHQTTLRMPYQDFVFWVWILSSSPAILKKLIYIKELWLWPWNGVAMHLKIVDLSNACRSWKNQFFNTFLFESYDTNSKILAKAEKYIFQYLFDQDFNRNSSHKHQDPKTGKSKISVLFWWENTPRSWQELENQNFNTFLFRTLIGRSSHKHQDPGNSWKNQNFNTFSIRILIEKSSHKHQDPAKSWKKQNFNTFLIRILIENSSHKHQDPAKSWKNQNFNTISMRKNTKILAKSGKNKISILFYLKL